jgi:phosphoribosylformylglycinamidine cyclo-ligase
MTIAQVNYGLLDGIKRRCLRAGLQTSWRIKRLGFEDIAWTRGESYHAIKTPVGILVTVPEGVGTKDNAANKTVAQLELLNEARRQLAELRRSARRMFRLLGRRLHRGIGIDNVAMNGNDLITSGVSPAEFMMHIDVGPDWSKDKKRWNDLILGTRDGCLRAGCCWGGGETAELNTLSADVCSISGMMAGFTQGELINPASITDGDSIVIFHSSGPMSNGYTGLRRLGEQLSDGYLTMIPGTSMCFAEAILQPTYLYVDIVERVLAKRIPIHAAFNITGHAFCKLMRPKQPHAYVIKNLPPCPPIFTFVQEKTGADDKKMFKTLNMGAGLAICIPKKYVGDVFTALGEMHAQFPGWFPFGATDAGYVEKSKCRSVHILPKNIDYDESDLQIR